VPAVSKQTYTCANCHGTFAKGWSDEQAAAEFDAMRPQYEFGAPGEDVDDCDTVCDNCFKAMASFFGWSVPA